MSLWKHTAWSQGFPGLRKSSRLQDQDISWLNFISKRINKFAPLWLQEEEILAKKVQGYPVRYDKKVKGFKERVVVQNFWVKITENPYFAKQFARGGREVAVRGCCEGKLSWNILKIYTKTPAFLWILRKFSRNFFTGYLWTTFSVRSNREYSEKLLFWSIIEK